MVGAKGVKDTRRVEPTESPKLGSWRPKDCMCLHYVICKYSVVVSFMFLWTPNSGGVSDSCLPLGPFSSSYWVASPIPDSGL